MFRFDLQCFPPWPALGPWVDPSGLVLFLFCFVLPFHKIKPDIIVTTVKSSHDSGAAKTDYGITVLCIPASVGGNAITNMFGNSCNNASIDAKSKTQPAMVQ